jgi:fumarate hydratase class II
VCAQVFGNDTAVYWGGATGQLDLNVMMPVIAHNVLESIRLLTNVVRIFQEKCVSGITANRQRCREILEYSMAMVTSLAPVLGYDRAAEIAKQSVQTGKTVRQLCLEQHVLPADELEKALDPVQMTKPGGEGSAGG